MSRVPVWWDGPCVTKRCPVLAVTGEVAGWLWAFWRCYEVRGDGFGGVVVHRVDWPAPGGLAAQDPVMVQALEHAATICRAVVREQKPTRTGGASG